MPRSVNIPDPSALTPGFSVTLTVVDGAGTIRVEIFHPGDPDGRLSVLSTALPAGAQTNITNLVAAALTYFKNQRNYV